MKKFIQELQRRNVIKAGLAYLVMAWLLAQVMNIIIPAFHLPPSFLKISIIVLAICFPFWLIFSWIYEITPEGLKKTISVPLEHSIVAKTGNRLNYIIITGLVLVIGLLIRDGFFIPAQVVENAEVATVATDNKSIAVLAFTDMSPEKDQGYFSDGISEEILNLLTNVPQLKVISRTSSFSYKGKEVKIKEIGEELQVNHILEGSIRKSGNTFRITVQLIDAKTGIHVWSETYDRNMEDILKIQDEIAAKVIQQLEISLLGPALVSPTVDIAAYNLYLQANQLYAQISSESTTNAIKLIKESIAIDSSYAPAWGLLNDLYFSAAFRFGTLPIEETIKQGKVVAKKEILLNSKSAWGYLDLAKWEFATWDFKAADDLLNKAIRVEPNNPGIFYFRAYFAYQSGKLDSAIELMLKSIELDPLVKEYFFDLGFYYWMNGEVDKTEEALNHFLLFFPNSSGANWIMSRIQLSLDHPEKAMNYIEREPDPFWKLYGKCMVIYAMDDKQEADSLLGRFIADYSEDMAEPNIADIYAFREEKDEAFKWLEQAFENKDSSLLEILNYPSMQNLWGDPRWNKLINKLGLPDNHGFHLD
ncbi:MAG TPA: hypothetical protein VK021_06460 [Flavobacteriaceae bacterium]|nr:hypothetical protein [Flavobacteriaceae bacterium]